MHRGLRALRRARTGTLVLVLCGGVLGGCASGGRWGHGARYDPPLERVRSAAWDAVRDPLTWVPALGAGVFLATRSDESVSDWASRETPLFGSRESAADASDLLRDGSLGATLVTALAAPSGCSTGEVLWHKSKGLAVELGTGLAVERTTVLLKDATDRLRPSGSDRESFPSGHASVSAAAALLTRRNLDAIPMDPRARRAARVGATAAAALAAWARVEAKAHHPSDVLAGYALGNGLGAFLHDAFLGREGGPRWRVAAEPVQGGFGLTLGVDL